MTAISQELHCRTNRATKALTTAVGLAAVAVVLTLFAALVSLLAALGAISLVCAMALYVAVRRLQAESERAEIDLINARDKYDAVIGSLCGALELEDNMRSNHVARV